MHVFNSIFNQNFPFFSFWTSIKCKFHGTEMAFVCFEKKTDSKMSGIRKCVDFIYIYYYVRRIIKCINKWLEQWKAKKRKRKRTRTHTEPYQFLYRLRQSMFSYSDVSFWPCPSPHSSLRLQIVLNWNPTTTYKTTVPFQKTCAHHQTKNLNSETEKTRDTTTTKKEKKTPFASKEQKLYEIILIYLRWQLDTIFVYVKTRRRLTKGTQNWKYAVKRKRTQPLKNNDK